MTNVMASVLYESVVYEQPMARGEMGFTLIELLVTVTMIGILVAVVSIGVGGSTSGSQTAANKGLINQAQASVDAFNGSGNTVTTSADSNGTLQNLQVVLCSGVTDLNAGQPCDNTSTSGTPDANGQWFYGTDGSTKPVITAVDYHVTFGNTTNQLAVGGWLRQNAVAGTFSCIVKGSGGNPTATVLACRNK